MAGSFFNNSRSNFSFPSRHSRNSSSSSNGLNFELPSFNFNNLVDLGQSFCQQRLSPNLATIFQNNPFHSSVAKSSKMVLCENCGTKLHFLKRKKTCADCSMDYCNNCFPREYCHDLTGLRRNRCKRCRIFHMQPLDRHSLMGLRIRDLKWYLDKKKLSYRCCKEKHDLVDLILSTDSHRASFPHNSTINSDQNSSCESLSIQSDINSWELVDADEINQPDSGVPTNSETFSVFHGRTHLSEENTRNTESISTENLASNPENNASNNVNLYNIEDIKTEEQILELSVREIKLILARNFVDFKGCCEKEELLQKALRLWRDTKRAKEKDKDDQEDSNLCKICMERPLDCVFLECGHVVTCIDCGKRMSECPICRQYVVRALRIFKS